MVDFLWLLVVAGGPVLLAAAFIYALAGRKRLGRQEKEMQTKATRKAYREDKN